MGIETHENLNLCIILLNELNQSVIDVKGKVKSPGKYFVGNYANINEIINENLDKDYKSNKVSKNNDSNDNLEKD